MIQEFKNSFSVFKTTEEIKNSAWWPINFLVGDTIKNNPSLPDRQYYFHRSDLTFEKVNLWEVLYYEPGSVGIYGAWDPYTEFFIIVHNLFVDMPEGIEVFYGQGAIRNLVNRAKELGIELPIGTVWIDPENKSLYDHFN